MGKFVLYGVIAFIVAFGADFFGFVDIPWIGAPTSIEENQVNSGRDATRQAIDQMFEEGTSKEDDNY